MELVQLATKVKLAFFLTEFSLRDVILKGSADDMQYFCNKVVRCHMSLEKIFFCRVTFENAALTLDYMVATIFVSVPNLSVVRTEGCLLEGGALSCVAYSDTLQEIHICHCNISDREGIMLAEGLSRLCHLKLVNMQHNIISDVGCHAIINILKKSTSISELKMDVDTTNKRQLTSCCWRGSNAMAA